ncbi:pyridoxal 5'-phosphate synthase [Aestuariibacter sp. AA17]|uniref:Pyridoxal 5'-phosphate synthase n=1 Tax=Fluctibacter corallii TaxID=2984329 RepID=A0ABT3A5X3_9ALTE|nr:pyridoxal 5'-phosphate synthase [Aestuariibacter sp. AA17]MCV2883672.1 pyridoxal 5'-phosphate synthase [Aestuariibacter sp. AA17]
MKDPLVRLQGWWVEATRSSPLNHKSAICVSTIDEDGYPVGRFVDLKAIDAKGLTICTSLASAKASQISRCNKVGVTAWWDHVGYQVRVAGYAHLLSDERADYFWSQRSFEAKLSTIASQQSHIMASEAVFQANLASAAKAWEGKSIPRPQEWGGFVVEPESIEFFQFSDDRLHIRECYTKRAGHWQRNRLQP